MKHTPPVPSQLHAYAEMLEFFELSSAEDRQIAEALKCAKENLLALMELWKENELAIHPSYERYKTARQLFAKTEEELTTILGDEASASSEDPIARLGRIKEQFLTELSEAPEDNLYQGT